MTTANAHAPAVRAALRSVRGAVADATEKLCAARGELGDRTAKAQGRLWKVTEGCVSRPEAEQRVDELLAVLAGRAGAHLHPLLEPQVDALARTLGALERVTALGWAALGDPEGLKRWIMDRLDHLAAQRGGWSELTRVERDRERRSVEHELAVLDAAAAETQPGPAAHAAEERDPEPLLALAAADDDDAHAAARREIMRRRRVR